MDETLLFAGTALADITPPLEVGLLTSSVKGLYEAFDSVRTPLKARVLALKDGNEMFALVALDLLALNDTAVGGWEDFKNGLCGELPAHKVILTCTHTHNAPESVALSGLYLTPIYKEWLKDVQHKVKQAIGQAIAGLLPCKVSVDIEELAGYSLLRRIPSPEGVVMSDAVQPIAPYLLEREPVDRRVHSIRFEGEDNQAIAILVHAVCHPVHEMCLPHISAEFPGEMCAALEEQGLYGMPFFLNGAAGDINPPTVSCGPAYAREHGRAIAEAATKKSGQAISGSGLAFLNSSMKLKIRPGSQVDNAGDAIARLKVIRIGHLGIVFLPGEPFTETALAIEKNSPFEHTIIAAYAENNIGYLPPMKAFREGGYESGPGKWSFVEPDADLLLTEEAGKLLDELYKDLSD